MRKKINSIVISLCLCITNINCCFALDTNNAFDIEKYAEIGQYDFSNYKIDLHNENISINYDIDNTNILNNTLSNKELLALNENEELKEVIKETINSVPNCDIEAIGYTTVYMRKIIDDETGNVLNTIPLTKEQYYNNNQGDVEIRATGTKAYDGKLTLYTTASFSGSQVIGTSVAKWSGFGTTILSRDNPSQFEDYISLTMPSAYIMTNHSTIEDNDINRKTAVCCDNKFSSTIYRYQEYFHQSSASSPAYYNNITLRGTGTLSGTKPTSVKLISKYVHTYAAVKPTITYTINDAGVSFSVDGNAWTISSYVII